MRRGLLLLVPLLTGCWGFGGYDPCEGFSRPGPYRFTGRVLDGDGAPIAGAQLWGLPMVRDGGAWTDDAGTFAFEVGAAASDEGFGETPACVWRYSAEVSTTARMDAGVWASASLARSASASFASSDAGARVAALPDLLLPANDVTVEYGAQTLTARADAGAMTMSVCGPEASPCRGEYTSALVLDVRELEDFPGLEVTAESTTPTSGGKYVVRRTVPLRPGSWLPPSRGAPCLIGTRRYAPCPLTDGDASQVTLPSGVSQVVVELPSPTTVGHAQLRGFFHDAPSPQAPTFNYVFEASSDGTTWVLLGERNASILQPAHWEFTPPREGVRKVRLRLSANAGAHLTRGAELSLY